MSFNGVRVFRYALLFEMGANMGGIIPCLFAPEMALSFMVKGPSQITPAAVSMMQWFGTLFLTGFTLPLALCYPNPVPSQGGNSEVVAWRRLTYILFAAGEAGLGTMMLIQWMQGNSGMSDTSLLVGAMAMGAFLGMRAFFLYVRPSWMEGQANARKAQ
ncbi:hypothetical protein LTR56_012759 [Elasticomyces elasticus]|nr:hypothetical protein LTR22_026635 [Elasticomyces elasticus]KAK3639036.1 hypothetical protein LTR56_012759 [Elasticomyces elasticus]KAK4918710.1 hypothetical protein LTR49_013497 [Elasticomyces elasticus]KAK5741435.1 hypothetical protein LTS12_024597 [Elasticomyces elasticus]